MPVTVLVVEDDEFMRCSLEDRLELENISYRIARNYAEAIAQLDTGCIDLVVTDIRLPDGTGIDLFGYINTHHPGIPVVLMTAYGDIADAVELVKFGALDYLTKPFELGVLMKLLKSRIHEIEEARIIGFDDDGIEGHVPGSGVLGVSPQMRTVERLIARLRNSESTVLITGESGVGKELIASMVHSNSPRRSGPMVRVNCAALAPSLIESELFGHEKGAYTGAHQRRIGRFEQASGGTLFLDEIAEIPPEIQVKLLRVLQEREVERVGGQKPIPLDVRIVAATQVDLEAAIENARFRMDLFYRINVIRIHVPPLRLRPEDILFLARRFIRESSEKPSGPVTGFTREAEKVLLSLSYKGNARELKNLIDRALVLVSGPMITGADLSPQSESGSGVGDQEFSLKESIQRAERQAIERALALNEWKVVRAAEMLGISRKSLWEKMKRFHISH